MIRTYQTGTCNKGHSLIELIVIIFIISIVTAIAIPSLWRTEKNILRSEAKHISNTLRYVYDEAVSKKESYLFTINLDTDVYGYRSTKESRNFRVTGEGRIKDVLVPSQGKRFDGEVQVTFGLLGPEEPVIIHLIKGDSEYTVIFNHITGRPKIIEGYAT